MESRHPSVDKNIDKLGFNLIIELFNANDNNLEMQFKAKYLFGVPMKIYRKKINDWNISIPDTIYKIFYVLHTLESFCNLS